DPVRRGRFGEGAVEVVAIDAPSVRSDEEEIEIAVVVEVDEHAAPRTAHVAEAGLGRDVGEGAAARVVEEVAASVATDGEQVEPAVVVEVGEGGERRTARQHDAGGLWRLAQKAGAHAVEMQRRLPLVGGPGRD